MIIAGPILGIFVLGIFCLIMDCIYPEVSDDDYSPRSNKIVNKISNSSLLSEYSDDISDEISYDNKLSYNWDEDSDLVA